MVCFFASFFIGKYINIVQAILTATVIGINALSSRAIIRCLSMVRHSLCALMSAIQLKKRDHYNCKRLIDK